MTSFEAADHREMLRQRNAMLVADCDTLEAALTAALIPGMLEPYREKMIGLCQRYRNDARANLGYLKLPTDSILEEVLSRTTEAVYYVRLLSIRLATPVTRSSSSDRLCLKILSWMHSVHSQTAEVPVAFADGDVSVWPFMHISPVYFFPSIEQYGLLYQPLHFHEFGHAVYKLHEPEMDALVKELQQVVRDALTPLSNRNDTPSQALGQLREKVINRWFDWAQEFFCDAVGLTIGGSAYLYAFSSYCNSLNRTALYQSANYLEKVRHPVPWLRVRLLTRRATELGLGEPAQRVDAEWNALARALKVDEEYHGYYDDSMADDVHRIVGDMLTEASPRQFLPEEIAPDRDPDANDTPVFLVNRAWHVTHTRADEYHDWEQQCIAAYLAA